MVSSISSLPPLLFFPHKKPPIPKVPVSSLLSSPKPRTNRKNHLRPKLPPKPQTSQPIFIETPQLILPKPHQEEEEVESESVQELIHESQSVHPLPNPNPGSLLLDLSLRFAALLAIQTAVAVWFFSRSGGLKPEESTDFENRVLEKEKGEEEKGEEVTDFERVVLEIREMAKKAREREAKEREESELERERFLEGILDEKDSVGGKLGRMKRLGFVRSNLRRKNAGKGFNGSKKMVEGSNADDNGGIQQINHQNPMREPPNLHEPRQSSVVLTEFSAKPADVESLVSPHENLSDFGNLQTSQISVERSKNDRGASLLNPYSTRREIQIKQSFKEVEDPSLTKSSNINGRSEFHSQRKETVGKSVVNKCKEDIFDQRKKPWWLRLPFVLAILLRRGSDRSCPKGLYSLKIDSPSEVGDSASYTIVFQDQSDATNFCYLLETFFEELDDFSADVVPLTIDELEEGVWSGALKVIVVRKGQLQLYAGQPLAEVETAVRSLLDCQENRDQS